MSQDTFDQFTVLFTKEKVFLGEKSFPLGQLTTDILNLDENVLDEIEERVNSFLPTVQALLQEKTDNAAHMAQEKLNPVWDLIFELPVYRNLKMDINTSYNLFPILSADQNKWNRVVEAGTEENRMFEKFISGLESFTKSLRSFRGQIEGMLELYFEPLARHNQETYAEAFAKYFSSMRSASGLFSQTKNLSRVIQRGYALYQWWIQQNRENLFLQKRQSLDICSIFCTQNFTEG